jgi:hypothetical protein
MSIFPTKILLATDGSRGAQLAATAVELLFTSTGTPRTKPARRSSSGTPSPS